jgi:hypothetical protein
MPKKKPEEERDGSYLDANAEREMEAAAGPLGGEDGGDESEEGESGSEEPSAPTLTAEEEANAERALEALRASAEALDVEKLGLEVNPADTPQDKYLAAGAIEKLLGVLIWRGLVQRDGAAWRAVPPGTLAKRRGELLVALIDEGGDFEVEPEAEGDFRALAKAGLADLDQVADDATLWVHLPDGVEERVMLRGAVAEVERSRARWPNAASRARRRSSRTATPPRRWRRSRPPATPPRRLWSR